MHPLDWSLLVLALLGVLAVVLFTQRYLRSVADFVVGGRFAGRYLLTNAGGEVSYGVATLVAVYEQIYQSGWVPHWWQTLFVLVPLIPSLLGFVTYRFRQTRAMTLAQYIEMRYSRGLRLFTGCLAFFSGMILSAINPAVQARFFVYLLGLPPDVHLLHCTIPTYALFMVAYMLGALALVIGGGQITLLTANCIEGIISQVLYLVVTIGLLCLFTWPQVSSAVLLDAPAHARPPGYSIINPFDAYHIKDFNLLFVILMYSMGIYYAQGGGGSALSAHEARMAGILGHWREFSRRAMISFLALCAITFLLHPDFASQVAPAYQALGQISNEQLQKQVRMPMAVGLLLPAGLKGIFCVIMVWTLLSGEAGALQGRANIFVQDILLPLRQKPFSKDVHIALLRWGCVGAAAVLITGSLLIRTVEYLIMWGAIASAIFAAGAGAVIIGGLYWKRGTTAAAWTSMLTGASLAFGSMVYKQFVPEKIGATYFGLHFAPIPLNGQIIAALTCLACITVYITVSLLTCREPFNMDWLLHRGQYAADSDADKTRPEKADAKYIQMPRDPTTLTPPSRSLLARILNFDAAFTRSDKIITAGVFFFNMTWAAFILVGTLWNLWHPLCQRLGLAHSGFDFLQPWSNKTFMAYWFIALVLMPFGVGIFTTIWFTWGGIRDLRLFFRRLQAERVDITDDGTVYKPGTQPPPAEEPTHGFPVEVPDAAEGPDPDPGAKL